MKKHLPLIAAALLLAPSSPAATQTDIPGPPGSGAFGTSVTVLPNGNFVVTDPSFDQLNPPVADVGAVYLYNPDGLLISTLQGSTFNDKVGAGGVTVLPNGNFVVRSPLWDNGETAAVNAGAATWGNARSGFIGGPIVIVSALNSLVGSTANSLVSGTRVTALTNGNYVVRSSNWDNNTVVDAGAATWGNGTTGVNGPVTLANSLIGLNSGDSVGRDGVIALTNGNYAVVSSSWNDGSVENVGAVTWGHGDRGISGPISNSNSLVGSSTSDAVGGSGVTALTNGNYVVSSSNWDNSSPSAADAGAVTWGNGSTGISGTVSPINSLVGSTTSDQVGADSITALTNGHYVVNCPNWDFGTINNAGAVTWGNGAKGVSGPINTANSLVGSSPNDKVGFGVTALTNGNYVILSPDWNNGSIVDAGAATWGNGTMGATGFITPLNSLVGSFTNDKLSDGSVTPLTNGNYVVRSLKLRATFFAGNGAATWGNGKTGITGTVTPANSLVGAIGDTIDNSRIIPLTNGNYVVPSHRFPAATWGNGYKGVTGIVDPTNSLFSRTSNVNAITALTNGNYVVSFSSWDSETTSNAGAAVWGDGTKGIAGMVSTANALFGSTENQLIAEAGVVALTNGNYVVNSPTGPGHAGAVTWGNGSVGTTGPVSSTNSLVGTSSSDEIGLGGVTPLPNGNYVVRSTNWDNTSFPANNAGAITLGNGYTGTAGPVSNINSILGLVANRGSSHVFAYDPARNKLIVGMSFSNIVSLLRGDHFHSLGMTGRSSPGAVDIAYAKHGIAAVNPSGDALIDFSLIGSGSSSGRNRALFAFSHSFGIDLVMQIGTPLSTLGGGLPSNTTASALFSQLFNRSNFGLFQATVKGTGITTANNRLLLLDNGSNVQILQRTGTPVPTLSNAAFSSFTEILQNHDQNLITIAYKLKSGGTVNTTNDEGLFLLDPTGVVIPRVAAREGDPAFNGGGTFGSFIGPAVAGLGTTIHFTALFKPTGLTPIPAAFSTTLDGATTARLTKATDPAPNSGGATFSTFPSISQQGGNALVKATLKGSPTSLNQGLYSFPANTLLSRKGDLIGGGLNIARIARFWPAGPNQVILQVQLTGVGVKTSNNQALLLRQSDNTYLTLLRTGTPAPGTGPAKLATISAVDVNPVSGLYAILGTLSGAPSSSNQALWTGDPKLGDNSPALQILRLPQLTLRKGNPYSTESTPSGLIRSIALKPAIDPTGAGGRGLAQALGASGDLALFITTDRNLTELVLLDR